jgi:general nucleoside transport system ATP-binding protein
MNAPSLAESSPVEPARRPAPGLEVIKLTKRFGTFVALEDATLKVEPGEFHALLGENGAGKSTFVKCVIGYEAPTSGDVVFDGLQVHFDSTRDAHAAGIGMVYQHFTLVPNMTVAENLVLVREVVPPVIDWKKEISELSDFMDRQPFQVPLKMPVRSLSAGQKQKLEILKQLYLNRRFLFLDEPTSVLTPGEADEVLGLLYEKTRRQELSVVIITHKFREVTGFCDAVTVLRRGRFAGSGRVSELTTDEMASMMIGSDKLTESAPRNPDVVRAPKLVITDLHANDDAGEPMLEGLSLTVHSGEIVGIAGVSGNGQLHLVECLAGQRPIEGGSIAVASKAYQPTRREIRAAGVRIIPEVPLANACAPDMSVSDNMALCDFDVAPIAKAKAFVSRRAIRDKAHRLIAGFSIKTPSPKSPIRNLSGGNVQRAVLARELSDPCEVLVTANPCFGLDFMATADIRARIIDSRNGGAAVLLVSSDLDELLEVSDRLCVMFDGRIVYETATAEADVTTIGKHMAGHA